MKLKTHDLNHDLTFSAHTINCVCHSIRSMFRVLGIYNFAHFPQKIYKLSKTNIFFSCFEGTRGENKNKYFTPKTSLYIIIKHHWYIIHKLMPLPPIHYFGTFCFAIFKISFCIVSFSFINSRNSSKVNLASASFSPLSFSLIYSSIISDSSSVSSAKGPIFL